MHGYAGHNGRSRNSLRYVPYTGDAAWPAAAVAVCHRVDAGTQRFQTGHSDEVVSLAVHPDGRHVATGQCGRRPSVLVWARRTPSPSAATHTLQQHMEHAMHFTACYG